MRELANRNILVVGASGAIGSAVASKLKELGANVLGTASSSESSVRLAAHLDQRLLLELESSDSITALTTYLKQSLSHLDGIVLAAGLVAFGNISETPGAVNERLMKVNFISQAQIISELLSLLSNSASLGQSPFIVSFSGVIAESPMTGLAAYSASKTALHGYAIAASKEFRKLGITWIDARPGHTESGLADRAIFGVAPNFGSGLTVDSVAKRVIDALIHEEKDLPSSSFKE